MRGMCLLNDACKALHVSGHLLVGELPIIKPMANGRVDIHLTVFLFRGECVKRTMHVNVYMYWVDFAYLGRQKLRNWLTV